MKTQEVNDVLSSPWKPCDVRGAYPGQVSPALFQNIGGAVGTLLPERSRVLVCGDHRLSTTLLKNALIEGLLSAGADVLDAGQIPTPVGYFTARQLQADAILIVTASHNPPADNGLKLMLGSMPPTPEQLAAIRTLATEGAFRNSHGHCEPVDLRQEYRRFILERWSTLALFSLPKVILDPGHGAWARLGPLLFEDLGFDVDCLACTIDGHFPSRAPDCARTKNLTGLRAAVLAQKNSIGVAWDGDGDRVAFIDEDGNHVSTDEISILFLRELLRQSGEKETIVIDIKFSDLVRRETLAHGGLPILERSGHAFMRGRMISEDGLLGLDACGHYFFRELGPGDDGLFSALSLLSLLGESGSRLSDLRRTIPPIFTTPELRLPADILPFTRAAERLQAAFPSAEKTQVDGIRLVEDSGSVLIRESSTEPVLSLRVEGANALELDKHIARTCAVLPEAESILKQQIEVSYT